MALNPDSMNSFDDIANIIPSPINNCNKELFIEDESKLGKVEKEIDSFGDISGINKDNNEIINDNSLLIVKKKNSPKKKVKYNLELKIKNFFENSKINELVSSSKNNNYINLKNNLYQNNNLKKNKLLNSFGKQNLKINNEQKYYILFDKNKKLDINSLREEYTKLKDDKNNNNNKNVYNNNNNDNIREKKYESIFVDNKYEKKNTVSINTNIDILNKRQKRFKYNLNYEYKNYYKTNNNSIEKNKNKNTKDKKQSYKFFSNDLFKETKSPKSNIIFNLNFKNNNHKNNNDYLTKSIKTYNTIFNSLRNINSSINSKEENDSWLFNSNNKIDMYNSNNNLFIKKDNKNKSIFDKLKLNKNFEKNQGFQFVSPKSNFMDFKNIKRNKNKTNIINRYNYKNNDFFYNLTNEENKNDNLSSIKKNKISLNKIMESNDNLLDKFSNNFDAIFNFVENKVKQKSNKINNSNYKEFNSKYKNKINFIKINPKLLSISQNEPKRNKLTNLFKEYNEYNFLSENNFKYPSNNFNFNDKLSEEKSPFESLFNKEKHYNNFSNFNSSYNGVENLKLKNNRKKFINLF